MQHSLLLWGFQDFEFISDFGRKIRTSLSFRDFYVQIHDVEKTVSVIDIQAEEIIRTKYDLSYLYHWLNRAHKKNMIVFIDLFTMVFSENFDENFEYLRALLKLDARFFFFSPNINYPQSLDFLHHPEIQMIKNRVYNFKKNLKKYLEIIINNESNSCIIKAPILNHFYINHHSYMLFDNKKKNGFVITNRLLNNYSFLFVKRNDFTSKLIECISQNIENKNSIIQNLQLDYLKIDNSIKKGLLEKLKPKINLSLDRFYSIKSGNNEGLFILWVLYLAMCDFFIEKERNSLSLKTIDKSYFAIQI
jgi:hypothetical protein